MANRNITLSLPDELIRRAKVLAALRDTSVSAVVSQLLQTAVGDVADDESVWSIEAALMDEGILRIGEITWTRDDLHARAHG